MAHVLRGDPEVSSYIMEIIFAFTNGSSILKKLRKKHKRHGVSREFPWTDSITSAEFRLSKSLRKGPEELTKIYTQYYYSGMGSWFARGDYIAHASLAETLVKLNSGLVGTIQSFLNHSKTCRYQIHIDYMSLTLLSDAIRREALHSMHQLHQRLSHSPLQYEQPHGPPCVYGRNGGHFNYPSPSTTPEKDKRKHISSYVHVNRPKTTRMFTKRSSPSQLVVLRSKATKKDDSSKSTPNTRRLVSGKSCTTSPTLLTSKYAAVAPVELPVTGVIKGTLGVAPLLRKQGIRSPSNPTSSLHWPLEYKPHHLTPCRPSSTAVPTCQTETPIQEKKVAPQLTPAAMPLPLKHRVGKVGSSSSSFASDSTKLGEIPQHHWIQQWDYPEAERRNAETVMVGDPVPLQPTRMETTTKRNGGFKFLRRGIPSGAGTKH